MRCNRALVSPFHITSYFKSLEGQHRLHWRAVHFPTRDIPPAIEDGRSATCVAESLGYDGRPDSPQDGRQRSPSIPDSATPSPASKKPTKWECQTARTDLLDIGERGVLEKRKKGKQMVFVAPADLSARLRKLEKEAGA
ncbi:MAG: hypothetical protein ACYDC1_02585 [Limisphaerales bacterium]